MNKDFDKIQQQFYANAEIKRFYWQTQNLYIQQQEQQLLGLFKDLLTPKDTLLEVGCGEGANAVCLRSMNITNPFTGVDFSDKKIQFCNSLNIDNTTFLKADARQLPFENNLFSVTLARDLLHHVNEDRKAVIKELLRVTRPTGKLIIIEGNVQKLTNYIFATIYKHEQGMKDSNRKAFENLLDGLEYSISTAEPSNFFRLALHYRIGLPSLANYKLFRNLLDLQQALFKHIIPKHHHAYWVIQILKTEQ